MEEQRKVIFGKYEVGRLLGKGTFAKVYYGRNLSTNESVAIKIINKDQVKKLGLTEQIKREISAMKLVKHPNVVELKEVMATKSKIYFVMELVKGGELFAKVAKGRVKEETAKRYFRQLISAVESCHARGISHRDLKPENILIDENGDLKISDFGLSAMSRNAGSDGLLHTRCGTPAYVAPEVLRKKGYEGAEADLWSCGVVLYVLLAGFLPFQDENVMIMYQKIFKAEYEVPPWFSSEARRVLAKLLVIDPKKRITIRELVKMRWFKGGFDPQHQPIKFEENKVEEVAKDENSKKGLPPFFNAFELISSMSSGFDLSALFEEDEAAPKKAVGSVFTSMCSASKAAEDILALAERSGLQAGKDKEFKLRFESEGEKGKLSVTAQVFEVAPDVSLVEFSKSGGDCSEFNKFLSEVLRPVLKDIVYAWQGEAA